MTNELKQILKNINLADYIELLVYCIMKIKMYIFVISFILICNGHLFCQVYTFSGDIGEKINISVNGNIELRQFYAPLVMVKTRI
jgi:hypothetical protein